MAITYQGKRIGALSRSRQGLLSYREILIYFVDDGEDLFEILKQPEIPTFNQRHPKNSGIVAGDVSISQIEGGHRKNRVYEVEVPYSTPEVEYQYTQQDDETPPWELPPYAFSLEPVDNVVPFEKAYQAKDKLGAPSKPVISSSGTPLGAVKNDANLIMKLGYYLHTINDDWTVDFHNSVNDADITVANIPIGAKKGLLRTFKPTLQRQYDEEGKLIWEYYTIDVEIEIKKDGWTRSLADMSLYGVGIDATNDNASYVYRIYRCDLLSAGLNGYGPKSLLDEAIRTEGENNGWDANKINDMLSGVVPIDEPMTLDGKGGLSFDGNNFKPVYLDFEEKPAISWEPLNLPESRS